MMAGGSVSDLGNQDEIAAVGAVASGAGVSPIPGLPSLHEIQLISAISSLPDSAVVEPKIAAIFLRKSEQTLARMRSEGSGPPFHQSNEGRGRNAKVTYVMGDLRAWHGAGKVSSTMEAAKQRGLCFATMAGLVPEQPFWSSMTGQLHLPALVGTPEEFDNISSMEPAEYEIVWVSMIEALTQPWSDAEIRKVFYKRYIEILSQEAVSALSAQEMSEFKGGADTERHSPGATV
jgi:hypothetical protein